MSTNAPGAPREQARKGSDATRTKKHGKMTQAATALRGMLLKSKKSRAVERLGVGFVLPGHSGPANAERGLTGSFSDVGSWGVCL